MHLTGNEPLVRQIIQAAFPSYEGKKITLHTAERVNARDTGWDDGCRDFRAFVDLNDLSKVCHMPQETMHTRRIPGSDDMPIPVNFALVTHVYRGQRQYIEITIHPNALNPFMLPAAEALDEDEGRVLYYTRSLKSSYAGISNYRQANSGLSMERWNAAKERLIARKLLNKAGALTVPGRNAAANLRF